MPIRIFVEVRNMLSCQTPSVKNLEKVIRRGFSKIFNVKLNATEAIDDLPASLSIPVNRLQSIQ